MGRGWIHGHRVASAAKKGNLFTKLSKEIAVAVKLGGASPDGNSRLKLALREAQKASMPKDTIDRAIKRGSGEGNDSELEEILYEGYGPHSVPFVVETLTDNKNRTAQDLRSLFTRHGNGLGASGSVLWNFDHLTSVMAEAPDKDFDSEEVAIEANADEVEKLDEEASSKLYVFLGQKTEFDNIQSALEKLGWNISKAELIYRSKTPVELNDEQESEAQEFFDKLDEHDDVKRVHVGI